MRFETTPYQTPGRNPDKPQTRIAIQPSRAVNWGKCEHAANRVGDRNFAVIAYEASMNLVFESERLLLRPLSDKDLDVSIAILTDPDVIKYVGGGICTEDEVAEDLKVATRRCADGCIGVWCVIDRATSEKLGTAILIPMPIDEDDTDWDLVVGDELPDCEIEIGYILKKSAWGKGYATEACKRLLKFAFEESSLEEVVATTDPENTQSRRVLEKSGMIYEGMRRAYGEQCPGFRMTRRQWLAKDL